MKNAAIIAIIVLVLASLVYAQEIKIDVKVDRTKTSLERPIKITGTITAPAPYLYEIKEGDNAVFSGRSNQPQATINQEIKFEKIGEHEVSVFVAGGGKSDKWTQKITVTEKEEGILTEEQERELAEKTKVVKEAASKAARSATTAVLGFFKSEERKIADLKKAIEDQQKQILELEKKIDAEVKKLPPKEKTSKALECSPKKMSDQLKATYIKNPGEARKIWNGYNENCKDVAGFKRLLDAWDKEIKERE